MHTTDRQTDDGQKVLLLPLAHARGVIIIVVWVQGVVHSMRCLSSAGVGAMSSAGVEPRGNESKVIHRCWSTQ